MKRNLLPVEYCRDVPLGCVEMAERRTTPLLDFYGRFVREITIQTLAASCYLQGIEDAWKFFGKPERPVPPATDYSI
jgi:hypothetical protein